MEWLVFTGFAIVSRAVMGVYTKVFSARAKVGAISVSAIQISISAVLALLIAPFFDGISMIGVRENAFALLSIAIFMPLGNVLYYRALETLESSVAQIAFSSILLWSLLLSVIFLDSSFRIIQLLGVALLFVAFVVLAGRNSAYKLNEGFVYMFLATLTFAIFQVASADLAGKITTGTYLVASYSSAAVLTWLLNYRNARKDIKSFIGHNLGSKLYAATSVCVFSIGYFVLSFAAYEKAPDRGLVVLLLTVQVFLAVILSIIFLKEREGIGRKVAAGIIAVLAGLLIKG